MPFKKPDRYISKMDNDFIRRLRLKPQRKKRKWVWILPLIIAGITSLYSLVNQSENKLVSPLIKKQVVNSLKGVVGNALEEARGTYAVAVKNLASGESYYLDEHQVFETGSLYKLWIMATVFKQIEDGKLTEDQILSEDTALLNEKFNIDSELAELTAGTVTLTVHDALSQMITISHNYAALLLTEKVKLSQVAEFLKTAGLTESSVGTDGSSPTSTPSDIALFYEKLYKGELVNRQYTAQMIDLLKNQQLNDGLPKYLPNQTQIAHKTGDIGWFKHDAGIVYLQSKEASPHSEKGDYIIVVMSKSDFPLGAQERIALLSKAIYKYFTIGLALPY